MAKRVAEKAWTGVDFDRTLATYEHGQHGQTGEPIQPMVDRVIQWLKEGKTVKIVTARVCKAAKDRGAQQMMVMDWCLKHIGKRLEVTAEKDFDMVELWDDRAVTVQPNTGLLLTRPLEEILA